MSKQQKPTGIYNIRDSNAFTALYHEHAMYVYNLICRYVTHTGEAEDLLQETFVAAYHSIHKVDENGIGPWIKRIAVNKSIDWLRKKKLVLKELDPDYALIDDEPVNEDDFEFTMEKVNKAIESLPLAYKTVFQLYAIEHIPQTEIAKLLGINYTNVRTQYFRARNRLLQTLKEERYER